MKFRFNIKNNNSDRGRGVAKNPTLFFIGVWQKLKTFVQNIHKSYILMTKKERFASLFLIFVALGLIGYKSYKTYVAETVSVPDNGGAYSEVVVGEAKVLNPITASTDAEKSVGKLMFRGLVKITGQNSIVPDIAKSYTVSDDGKVYTFVLRDNLTFSDGQPLTANDVLFTVNSIQQPATKSPVQKTWADVDADVVDQSTITFTLQNAYGPFIYNCDFGIVPSHLSTDEFSKRLVGDGPYQFFTSTKDDKGRITSVDLIKNTSYYGDKPYIDKVKISFAGSDTEAIQKYQSDNSLSGIFAAEQNRGQILDYNSSRQLGLILNVRKDALKDKVVRQKILSGNRLDSALNLSMITLNIPTQQRKAEELKARFAAQNIKLSVNYLSATALQDAIAKKSYDAILYGFDFGYDRDPYVYWHSSQIGALNLAGFSDKNLDIQMEDARMLPDVATRNAKYNQIYDGLNQNYVVEFYSPVVYNFAVKDEIKGITGIVGTQPSSRFENIEKWYVNEKRVRNSDN